MTFNIGLIGTGIFAQETHLPALKATNGFKLVGCFNRSKEKALQFAQMADINVFDSIEDLIKNVDIVDCLIPIEFNLEVVKLACKYGKPIMIEKPIAANLKDGWEIVKLSKTNNIMVLENYCYHNGTRKLVDLLPKIGKVSMFSFQVSKPFKLSKYHTTKWRQTPKHIGGFLSDAGVHDIATITEVLGFVEQVSAHSNQLRKESGTVDQVAALFLMQNGVFGTYIQSRYQSASKPTLKFEIVGENGSLVYDGSEVIMYTGPNSSEIKETVFKLIPNAFNGVAAEFENFRDVLLKKDQMVCTPKKAFMHYATMVAAIKSAERNGENVIVQDVINNK